jgi:hypothetical protein
MKPIEMKARDVEHWTFWKVRPPPKRKKVQKTAGETEELNPLAHSENLPTI